MADATGSPSAELPPPAPGVEPAIDPVTAVTAPRRAPRPGQLAGAWRAILVFTWVAAFVAYLAVWKASVEIGLATWWLGPRSNPQPVFVQLIPFYVVTVFGILASYNLRRLPAISAVGSVVLALIAVPDLSRSAGLAVVEFAIAGAVLLVSLAASTGTYRAVRADTDRDSVGAVAGAHGR